MLQDLDSLAARIGQMVQFTRQLQSERAALLARLQNLEQERDALRDQVQRREAEYSSAAERVAAHEAQIHSYQAQAQAEQATLQVEEHGAGSAPGEWVDRHDPATARGIAGIGRFRNARRAEQQGALELIRCDHAFALSNAAGRYQEIGRAHV